MNKITKLRVCDLTLLALTVAILASGIQLEGWWLGMGFVWLHIVLGVIFTGIIAWHLQLHYGRQNWITRLRKQKSVATRLLGIFGALTILSAIAATIHIFITWQHSSLGGWHGKFGFVMASLAIGHTVKRRNFFTRRRP